jgi:hypothetical protein
MSTISSARGLRCAQSMVWSRLVAIRLFPAGGG